MPIVARAHFPGAPYVDRSLFTASADHGRWTVRYRPAANSYEMKLYGKTEHLLRAEVSCPDRDAVTSLTGARRAALSGGGAVDLAADFVARARHHVDQLCRHAKLIDDRRPSPHRTVNDLQDLFELAAGRSLSSAGVVSLETMKLARVAIDQLLMVGVFDARGLRRGTSLRDCLDRLSEGSGPLMRQGRKAVFALRADRLF